ncbi:MAG TPA: fibronectin type III domain-containing protein [Bacteroidia bacterium]|jgi:hypothetical protein|nr:fibronectin type III domain-containing protein [Bacteroidia bacterium]
MKKKITSHISLILFLTISLLSKAQTIVPYLQSATPTSIYVTWKTDSVVQTLVKYGTAPNALNTTVQGVNQILSDVGYPNNFYYHSVGLKNLAPNTLYYYQVISGSLSSSVGSFKTSPLPGNAATIDGHIRFLVMGDNEDSSSVKFDSLMVKAKRKCEQKYAGAINENISGILMLGDQVNDGGLRSYEKVHFGKSKYLSNVLPIQTTVGENEVDGTLGLSIYNKLFYYDSLKYKGISSNTENYYAYQVGNVLIINLSTEHTGNVQFTWLQQIFAAATTDPTVHWIISLGHRPYQAEQFVGDISPWIRNSVVPYLSSSSKYLMHIGGHHHLYARGQLKDVPVYNVVSGGASYNQFWETSTEQDMDDVQKTIPNWSYNIIDIDVPNGKVDVEAYSIGSANGFKNNFLIDQFHRYKNKAVPVKPSLTNTFGDSLQLPYTIVGSAFSSPVSELLNSTEFQISSSKTFATLEKDIYRDYENLFGYAVKADSTKDLNLGVTITNLELAKWSVPNGKHYLRVRYRDRNLDWSPWSATDSFKVVKSVAGPTTLTTDKKYYELSDSVKVSYTNGPGEANDWIGLFKEGTTPAPGIAVKTIPATGSNGFVYFKNIATAGQYYVAYFTNGTYTELTQRVPIFVGSIPVVTTNKANYIVGDTVLVNYTHGPNLDYDWVGVYKVGSSLNGVNINNWKYVTGTSGQIKVIGLDKGYYFASYFLQDSYQEACERTYFTVDEKTTDTITSLVVDKAIYKLGESIQATWNDAPGLAKDELITYASGSTPGTSTPVSIKNTNAVASGTVVLSGNLIPKTPGDYFISMYTNGVFKEISNRVNFTVIDTIITSTIKQPADLNTVKLYPNPVAKNGIAIIESSQIINKIEFIDLIGRVLFAEAQINSKTYAMSHLNVPTGIYYARVYQQDNKIQIVKVVIE